MLRRRLDCCWHRYQGPTWGESKYPTSECCWSHSGTGPLTCDSPLLPPLTWKSGNKLLVHTAWEQHLRQGKHKYFRPTWNLIIPCSLLCTWQLSQPQIWALSAHTMCSCTAVFNWQFLPSLSVLHRAFSTWELPRTKHPTDPLNSHVKAHEASLQSPNRKENTRAEGFD